MELRTKHHFYEADFKSRKLAIFRLQSCRTTPQGNPDTRATFTGEDKSAFHNTRAWAPTYLGVDHQPLWYQSNLLKLIESLVQ